MASLDYVLGELRGLPADQRAVWTRIFQHLMKDQRFGHPLGEQPDPSVNFGGGFFHGRTPVTLGREVAVEHGFGRVPYLAIPILLLDTVGASVGPFTVTRAADDRRIYLESTESDLPFSLFVEG